MTEWNAINTTNKVVLIGREIRMATQNSNWHQTLKAKLNAQPPAALVYTWWYNWMSFLPPLHTSLGGRPWGDSQDAYLWNLELPTGFVNYEDGLQIRNAKNTNQNTAANVTVNAVFGNGTHYNVVAKLSGYTNPQKQLLITAHYDTVMCSGFCDNGAGTAGLIELANIFSQLAANGTYKPDSTITFVAFTGEELDCVGSVNYIKQHIAEMINITAVINLDCIGSSNLYVTETNAANGFDLDQTITEAARSLNVTITTQYQAGSDHEAFQYPAQFNDALKQIWGYDAQIAYAVPVTASAMLGSTPLLYNDKWSIGTPGWIHTSYDNSTSTTTLGWIQPENLGKHIKVAAVATVRISPSTEGLLH